MKPVCCLFCAWYMEPLPYGTDEYGTPRYKVQCPKCLASIDFVVNIHPIKSPKIEKELEEK